MKKKLTAVALVVCMLAIMLVGASLAYFTDKDEETNTFTLGNVKIDLIEKGKDGSAFVQDQKLLPGEGNAITKSVTVKNVGTEDAYMWIEVLIPAALDKEEAKDNDLHFNPFDTYRDKEGNEVQVRGSVATKEGYGDPIAVTKEVKANPVTINGVTYNVYREYIEDDTPKATDASTYPLLSRVFMDQGVTQCTDSEHNNCYVLQDGTTHYTGTWNVIVRAYGIQAAGFDSIEAAMAAYYAQ